MIEIIARLEVTLFIFGFVYGALAGNQNMNLLLRAMCGGLFFALFFVAVPVVIWQDRRRQ